VNDVLNHGYILLFEIAK